VGAEEALGHTGQRSTTVAWAGAAASVMWSADCTCDGAMHTVIALCIRDCNIRE
jgi:hypothetical protein